MSNRIFFLFLLLLAGSYVSAAEIDVGVIRYIYIGRVFERILIVLLGGSCMYMGYRLFSVSMSESGKMVLEKSGWKFQLSQVGPGVFFALFGSVVLGYAMFLAPTYSIVVDGGLSNTGVGQDKSSSGDMSAAGSTSRKTVESLSGVVSGMDFQPSSSKDYLVSLNTLEFISHSRAPQDESSARILSKAQRKLEPLKAMLIDISVGRKGAYNEWARLNDLKSNNFSEYSERMENDTSLNERLQQVDELLHNTIAK